MLGVAGKLPTIGDGAFVAPSAALIGDVQVGKGASIWYGTVLRGEHLSPGMHRLALHSESERGMMGLDSCMLQNLAPDAQNCKALNVQR